jgi:hypothetical protein
MTKQEFLDFISDQNKEGRFGFPLDLTVKVKLSFTGLTKKG